MANLDAQSEELLALQSIFDDTVLIVENDFTSEEQHNEKVPRGRFIVNINLPPEFKIRNIGNNNQEETCYSVQYLPPLNLYFELLPSYPSETCPAYFLTCCWLTLDNLSKICEELESMWKKGDGEVILFQWVTFLQEEVLNFLNITDTLDISRVARYKYNSKNLCNLLGRKNISRISNNALLNNESSSLRSDSAETSEDTEKSNTNDNSELISSIKVKPSTKRGTGLYDQRAVLDLTNDLVLFTQEYDRYKRKEIFKNNWFTCLICFSSKKGDNFVFFSQCDHMYCRECLKSYFEIQIKDGNVTSLNCPHEKCPSQADGTQVKALVNPDLFYKYDRLLLSRTLDGMTDVEYCPRQDCQCAVLIEKGSTLGCCPACKYTFCILCRMVFHGVAPCKFKNRDKQRICEEYMKSHGQEREMLEKRYGKKVLKVLADEMLSETWKEQHSKNCPRCNISIEKTEGCNKMTCYKCGSYFCWICMTKLNSGNPYYHFSDPKSSCYERLFPPEEMLALGDIDDIDWVEPGDFLD